jgi:hypothetical protein
MRTYGALHTKFWTNPELRQLDDQTKLFLIYLLTSPHSNSLGCYYLPLGYAAVDMRKDPKTISKLLRNGLKTMVFVYDEDCEWIFLVNYLKFNYPLNPNQAKSVEKAFYEVPQNFKYYRELAETVLKYCRHLSEPFRNRLQTIVQQFRNIDQDQNQDHKYLSTPLREYSSSESSDDAPDPPKNSSCPHQKIIDLYHEVLPELPRVKVWNPHRQALLRARWKEDPERQSLDWWRQFFKLVRASPFLMGKKSDFRADLEWLVRPRNFPNVLEGRYTERPKSSFSIDDWVPPEMRGEK